jgi:UV excision repair protein RAD23
MSAQAEHAFVKAFVNILASQPVTFDDDFQEQPEKTLKKIPVVQVRCDRSTDSSLSHNTKTRYPQLDVPPPPELKRGDALSSGASYKSQ